MKKVWVILPFWVLLVFGVHLGYVEAKEIKVCSGAEFSPQRTADWSALHSQYGQRAAQTKVYITGASYEEVVDCYKKELNVNPMERRMPTQGNRGAVRFVSFTEGGTPKITEGMSIEEKIKQAQAVQKGSAGQWSVTVYEKEFSPTGSEAKNQRMVFIVTP